MRFDFLTIALVYTGALMVKYTYYGPVDPATGLYGVAFFALVGIHQRLERIESRLR